MIDIDLRLRVKEGYSDRPDRHCDRSRKCHVPTTSGEGWGIGICRRQCGGHRDRHGGDTGHLLGTELGHRARSAARAIWGLRSLPEAVECLLLTANTHLPAFGQLAVDMVGLQVQTMCRLLPGSSGSGSVSTAAVAQAIANATAQVLSCQCWTKFSAPLWFACLRAASKGFGFPVLFSRSCILPRSSTLGTGYRIVCGLCHQWQCRRHCRCISIPADDQDRVRHFERHQLRSDFWYAFCETGVERDVSNAVRQGFTRRSYTHTVDVKLYPFPCAAPGQASSASNATAMAVATAVVSVLTSAFAAVSGGPQCAVWTLKLWSRYNVLI